MIMEIKENEVNQNIYFLGKKFQYKEIGDDKIYNYEVLKELNELNYILMIKNINIIKALNFLKKEIIILN